MEEFLPELRAQNKRYEELICNYARGGYIGRRAEQPHHTKAEVVGLRKRIAVNRWLIAELAKPLN